MLKIGHGWHHCACGDYPDDQRIVLAVADDPLAFEEFFRARWVRGEWRSEDGELTLHRVDHWIDLPYICANGDEHGR